MSIKLYILKGKYSGMALWPFMLLKRGASIETINHEEIHFEQQKELLIVPFYVLYLLNYLVNLLIYKNHHQSYRAIVFEKEAYSNQHNLKYVSKRKLMAFINYL